MPGPGWTPLLAAIFTAAFFLLLTVKAVAIALVCGVLAVVAMLVWMWQPTRRRAGRVDIGGGIRLPTYVSGPLVAFLVGDDRADAGRRLALSRLRVFLSLPLDRLARRSGPSRAVPDAARPALAVAALIAVASCLTFLAGRLLPEPGQRSILVALLLAGAAAGMIGAVGLNIWSHWQTGVGPTDSAYGAMVYMATVLDCAACLCPHDPVRRRRGAPLVRRLDREWRVSYGDCSLSVTTQPGKGSSDFCSFMAFRECWSRRCRAQARLSILAGL